MLYLNVIDDAHKARASRVPLFLAVSALLAIALFYPMLVRRGEPQVVRPLGIEEKEAVISLFSALSNRVPELSGWTDETREVFEEDSLPSFVDASTRAAGLVRYEDDTLYFSSRFFEADSAAQENALLEAVVSINQPAKIREGEIAISTGD